MIRGGALYAEEGYYPFFAHQSREVEAALELAPVSALFVSPDLPKLKRAGFLTLIHRVERRNAADRFEQRNSIYLREKAKIDCPVSAKTGQLAKKENPAEAGEVSAARVEQFRRKLSFAAGNRYRQSRGPSKRGWWVRGRLELVRCR